MDVHDKWGEKMRPIDADALIDELQKDEAKFDKEAEDAQNDPSYTECYSDAMWSRANGIRDAIIEVYDAPTIDAESVVRCKECKHYLDGFCFQECSPLDISVLGSRIVRERSQDDYCSYGERKESE